MTERQNQLACLVPGRYWNRLYARLYDAAPLEVANHAIILLLLIPSSRSLCQWTGLEQCSSTVSQNFILHQIAIYKNCVAATRKVYRILSDCFGKHWVVKLLVGFSYFRTVNECFHAQNILQVFGYSFQKDTLLFTTLIIEFQSLWCSIQFLRDRKLVVYVPNEIFLGNWTQNLINA